MNEHKTPQSAGDGAALLEDAGSWISHVYAFARAYARTLYVAVARPLDLLQFHSAPATLRPAVFALSSATLLYCWIVVTAGGNPFTAYELPPRVMLFLQTLPVTPLLVPLLLVIISVVGSAYMYIALRLVRRPASMGSLVDLAAFSFAGPQTVVLAVIIGCTAFIPDVGTWRIAGVCGITALTLWHCVRYLPAVLRVSGADWPRLTAAVVLAMGMGAVVDTMRPPVVKSYEMVAGSMAPAVIKGDRVLANLTVFRWRPPHLAEIVVFVSPRDPARDLLARVVGLPGDTIAMRDGVISRNGTSVHEPYTVRSGQADGGHKMMAWQEPFVLGIDSHANYRPTRDNWGPLVVPIDRYFMLGDNRDYSLDSRYYGFVPLASIRGSIFFRYWPTKRSGQLKP